VPTLIARSGPLTGRRYEIDDEIVLGREGATITLADAETSRRHAAIRIEAGRTMIEDLGSTNGTFVDGRQVHAATELTGGETIKVGQTIFYFEAEAEPEPEIDPGATRVAQRPETLDPDRTSLRPQPAKRAPDPDRTSLRPRPPKPRREPVAAAPAVPPAPPIPALEGAPAPAASVRDGAAAVDQPFGAFAPPAARRRRGIATRKLAPTLLSFATIIGTAAALLVYFVAR
jgi:pSer/pThr/pTyr-binding forkhead associated (FHA) protein